MVVEDNGEEERQALMKSCRRGFMRWRALEEPWGSHHVEARALKWEISSALTDECHLVWRGWGIGVEVGAVGVGNVQGAVTSRLLREAWRNMDGVCRLSDDRMVGGLAVSLGNRKLDLELFWLVCAPDIELSVFRPKFCQ